MTLMYKTHRYKTIPYDYACI